MFEEVLILQEGALILAEDAETLREKTVGVSGPKAKVDTFLENKEVIQRTDLAGHSMAYAYGTRQEAETVGLQTEAVPIQELMIHLTEKKGG